jgi:putative phosphoesterase
MAFRIGVISDTHGVVHPAVPEVFANVDHIIHAGDICGEHVLEALRALAPVTSVDGNNDGRSTGEDILRLELAGLRILLTHILPRPRKRDARVVESLKNEPADVVFFGHSHLPHNEVLDGVRYFNPASSGPRRFDYPVSVGLFEKSGRAWKSLHVALDERSVEALNKWMNQLSRG